MGYEPSTAVPGAIARLLLARKEGETFTYVGSVGTGFKHAQARELKKQLDALRTTAPVFAKTSKNLIYAHRVLLAEIEYRGWTEDGKLRHSSFKRPRDKAD